jgi:tetratricopeptide (TPR) repeat protein
LLLAVLLAVPATASAKRAPAPDGPVQIVRRPRPLPPPVLMIRRNRVSRPLQMTKVDIKATIVGHLARTEMTMTFYNPNRRAMAGDLYFPLPQGSTVSGYALDIKGKMVEGVVVGKDRARQVFEAEVRKGVDPGLVEWTKGQNFKTRVFPIPAQGTRTVRVSYVSEVLNLKEGAVYYMPLSFRDRVKKLTMRVEAIKAAAKPIIAAGGPRGFAFKSWRDSYVAQSKLENVKLTKDLYVRLPQLNKHPVRVERSPDGKIYFSIRDHVAVPPVSRTTRAPRRIALWWDASLSRAELDHRKELSVIDAYARSLGKRSVDVYLVPFRDVADKPRRFRLPAQRAALKNAITDLAYDGGTQLGSVGSRRLPAVDVNLLFSDGVSNYGREIPRKLRGPVYAFNTATTANHATLRYLAMRSGGAYFNLRTTSVANAVAGIGAASFSFISAKVSGAELGSLYPKLRVPVHGTFDIAGKLTAAKAVITLQYGYGNQVTKTKKYVVERKDAAGGNLLRRYWAQKKLDDLIVFPDRNDQEITKLGRDYSIVTPGTSLIVLENLGQYLQHEIRPPASLAKMRKAYDTEMQRRVLIAKRNQSSKLARVIKLWEQKVAWWNKRYRYPKNYRYGGNKAKKAEGRTSRSARGPASNRPAARRPRRVSPHDGNVADIAREKDKTGKAPGPAATIEMKPWDPKTPYLAALKEAAPGQRYAVYLQQRKKYGAAPAFYLDVANYFLEVKQTRLALRILSNLAELELENPALLRVLAHRLAQVGQYDRSIQVFERVLDLRPEEPQSYRDLALVLERRGDRVRRVRARIAGRDYRRAMKLLSRVVMERWSRFDQIEVIALTELNNMLPKARRYGRGKLPVDKRLIKHLDMDIRIVMSWDADNTDMDLHVVEPSGEEAYYSHNRTRIGGMVSRDFTQGYGPEVYSVRRAMRGAYTIRTKFYGSSAAKLIGAVTLQVDVYTNYGRPNQKRKSITLRLTKTKETFTVGKIRF